MNNRIIMFATSGLVLALVCVFLLSGSYSSDTDGNFFARLSKTSAKAPGNFQLLTLQSVCSGGVPQVTGTWSPSAGATSYLLERHYPWPSNWETTGGTDTLTLTDATWSTGYTAGIYAYRVRATNSRGQTISNSVQVTIPACVITDPVPPTPTSTSRAIQWGAFVGYTATDISDFETLVGRPVQILSIFVGWGPGAPFPSEFGPLARDTGKTLLIFWEPYGTTLDAILSGQWDSYMKQFADASKTYGGPIILAPLHEMNGNWDPWDGTVGTNTPAKVIAAWKRIYTSFSGVTNVKFAWDVNSGSVPDTASNQLENYYPGDGYVDYVGMDGFNFGNPWQTWDEIFGTTLQRISAYKKPIYIFSIASAADSRKAAWISDALSTQMITHPEIKGWVWFNENKESDWRVNSDPESLNAFRKAISSY